MTKHENTRGNWAGDKVGPFDNMGLREANKSIIKGYNRRGRGLGYGSVSFSFKFMKFS